MKTRDELVLERLKKQGAVRTEQLEQRVAQHKAEREMEQERHRVARERLATKRAEQLEKRIAKRRRQLYTWTCKQELKKPKAGLTPRQELRLAESRLLKREEMARSLIYASEEVWGAFWEVFSRESANNFLLPLAFETFNREYEVAVGRDL